MKISQTKEESDVEKAVESPVEPVEVVQEESPSSDTSTETKPSPRGYGRQFKSIDEGRRITLGVGLPSKLIDQIVEEADREDIPRSEVVTRAVRAYFKGASLEKIQELENALEQTQDATRESKHAAEDLLVDAKMREKALIANLPILKALDENDFEGEYACDGLGINWLNFRPLHPFVLGQIKDRLDERSGKYDNDYDRFLELAAAAENVEPEELRRLLDESIKKDSVFEGATAKNQEDAKPEVEKKQSRATLAERHSEKEDRSSSEKRGRKQDREDDDFSDAFGIL
ncbi:MAG: hypothetical protein JRN52_10885 [Nitrososphaerota archaeon]|nr:hypothetical protein [Nitrososphaerota archaeon]